MNLISALRNQPNGTDGTSEGGDLVVVVARLGNRKSGRYSSDPWLGNRTKLQGRASRGIHESDLDRLRYDVDIDPVTLARPSL